MIFKILCTFWGVHGGPSPPSQRIFSGLTNKKEKKLMVGAFGEGRSGVGMMLRGSSYCTFQKFRGGRGGLGYS